jgi:hypothetical protein
MFVRIQAVPAAVAASARVKESVSPRNRTSLSPGGGSCRRGSEKFISFPFKKIRTIPAGADTNGNGSCGSEVEMFFIPEATGWYHTIKRRIRTDGAAAVFVQFH